MPGGGLGGSPTIAAGVADVAHIGNNDGEKQNCEAKPRRMIP